MRFFFISLLLLTSLTCSAQRILQLSYTNEPRLVLSGFQIADVVDVRNDSATIGLVHVGATNRVEIARLAGGCANAILKYIQLVAPMQTRGTRVAMVIKDLRISEDILMVREMARLHVAYEFYDVDAPNMPLIFNFTHDFEEQSFDVTSKHEANIRRSVREALRGLTTIFEKGEVRPLPEPQMSASGSYAIVEVDTPARGVYRSFEEFRDNKPSITDFEVRERNHPTARKWGAAGLQPCHADGTLTPFEDSLWGFSDGGKIYIKQGREYFELTRRGSTWTFYGYRTAGTGNTQNVARRTAFGMASNSGNSHTATLNQVDLNTGQVYQVGQ